MRIFGLIHVVGIFFPFFCFFSHHPFLLPLLEVEKASKGLALTHLYQFFQVLGWIKKFKFFFTHRNTKEKREFLCILCIVTDKNERDVSLHATMVSCVQVHCIIYSSKHTQVLCEASFCAFYDEMCWDSSPFYMLQALPQLLCLEWALQLQLSSSMEIKCTFLLCKDLHHVNYFCMLEFNYIGEWGGWNISVKIKNVVVGILAVKVKWMI